MDTSKSGSGCLMGGCLTVLGALFIYGLIYSALHPPVPRQYSDEVLDEWANQDAQDAWKDTIRRYGSSTFLGPSIGSREVEEEPIFRHLHKLNDSDAEVYNQDFSGAFLRYPRRHFCHQFCPYYIRLLREYRLRIAALRM